MHQLHCYQFELVGETDSIGGTWPFDTHSGAMFECEHVACCVMPVW